MPILHLDVEPYGIVKIVESGIKSREDMVLFQNIGFDAALVGETIVKSGDIEGTIRNLTGEVS